MYVYSSSESTLNCMYWCISHISDQKLTLGQNIKTKHKQIEQ